MLCGTRAPYHAQPGYGAESHDVCVGEGVWAGFRLKASGLGVEDEVLLRAGRLEARPAGRVDTQPLKPEVDEQSNGS